MGGLGPSYYFDLIMNVTARVIGAADDLRYRRADLSGLVHTGCDASRLEDADRVDVATVAFNNADVIGEQIRLIGKNLSDPHEYTVADASDDADASRGIRAHCEAGGVGYIRLPRSRSARLDPSAAHGRALNWLFRKFLRPRGARYAGLIDHDVFPIRPTSVIEAIGRAPAWGHMQRGRGGWYLWPGLCFFDMGAVGGRELDFRPGRAGDTGARNHEALFRDIDEADIVPPPHTYGRLREGNGDPQSHGYELIGDWLHTFNASHWKPTEDRDHLVADLLARF